jgi:hypothetical protein
MDDLVNLPESVGGVNAENGSIGSHIAIDAIKIGTQRGIPIIFGAAVHNIPPDSILTVDGNYGNVFLGTIPLQTNGDSGLITQTERETARSWLESRMQNLWRFVGSSTNLKEQVADVKQTINQQGYANLRSLKAREIMVFNAAIPEEIRQTYTIVRLDTQENLVRTIQPILTRIFAHRNHATIRTCHNPALSADGPWALVRNMGDFERFLTDEHYSVNYGGFREFLSHPQLTELLVGDIPIGKMENDPLIQHHHAAWTLSCTDNGEVKLQVRPTTPTSERMKR